MIRVLHTLHAPDGRTRYVDHMLGAAPPDVEVRTFSWRRALFGRYDVLHVHWPESLVRHPSRPGALVKRALTSLLLARLGATRTPVVRTVHNPSPHEAGDTAEERMLARIDARTELWIALNPTTELPPGRPAVVIPHGHYREVYPPSGTQQIADRILQFGLLRPYKGVERLIGAFGLLDRPGASLRVVGRPFSPGYAEELATLAAGDPRVELRLAFVSDEELAEEVRRAELVVLPYREMHNSGAVLVALSLDRPVLVPRSPANEALAAEAGGDWVRLFDGELTPVELGSALDAARTLVSGSRPELSDRDWMTVGERHRQAYARALGLGPAPRRSASTATGSRA